MSFQVGMSVDPSFKSPIEQKIRELILAKGMSISDLYQKAEVDEGTIYNIFKKGRGRVTTLKKIADALEVDLKEIQDSGKYISSDEAQVDDESKHGKILPYEKAKLYLSQLPDKDAEHYIPYYDVEITAGRIELYFDDVEEIPEGYVYAPHYQGCVMCNVKGNSMYDLIYPGARLYVYHLSDRKYIDYGQIYLVVTAGLRVLKYIRKHPTDDSKVVLASHNPSHDTWDVEKVDILNLFLVKGFENQTSM